MADPKSNDAALTGVGGTPHSSDMNPPVVPPLSKADPSVAPEWDEHVHGYFNGDAHPGEAVPSATHEAKE